MTTLKDSIEIKGSSEEIFNGLVKVLSSTENFKTWHKDHLQCQWLKGEPFKVGSVLYVEEYLHRKLHKFKFVSTKLEPNRRIEYKLRLPASIICTGGTFIIEPKGEKCIFVATLSFKMGWLFSMFAKIRVDAIKKHMKEEGENLKNIIEKDVILSDER